MNLLLFIESLSSGGAERQLTGLAVLLKKSGYNVKVLYYGNNHFYTPWLRENNVCFDYMPAMLDSKTRPFRLATYINHNKPDCVISYLTGANMAACFARMLVKFPLIVSERNTNQSISLKDKILFNLYRIADAIVPNSFSQAEFIRTNFPSLKAKIEVITNFVDTDIFQPQIENSDNRIIKILTVARITKQKNCIAFLDAIRRIKLQAKIPFHIDWFGNGYGNEYEKSVRQRVIDNDIEDVFTFHPASTEILKEYQISDVFCLPSKFEGYPNVICEAMSCGLPILCSCVCDNPRIVKDGENGFLFNPDDVGDISQVIQKMLNLTKEQRRNISNSNRKRAVELFSKDVFVKRYIKLIEKVIGKKR